MDMRHMSWTFNGPQAENLWEKHGQDWEQASAHGALEEVFRYLHKHYGLLGKTFSLDMKLRDAEKVISPDTV